MNRKFQLLALSTILCVSANANAAMLSFSFQDGIGDQSRSSYSDTSKMSVLFDNLTGDYTITLTATPDHPFSGWIDVNANMVNPDTPVFHMNQSYFFANNNLTNPSTPTTSITLSGTEKSLLWWKIGDRVALSSIPFGIAKDAPPSSFSSNVDQGRAFDYGFWSTDEFSYTQIATISAAVPEPETYAMLASGLFLVAAAKRRRPQ